MTTPHYVYIAARLFSMMDRYAAAVLAHEVDRQLGASQMAKQGLRSFLPFRDTKQQDIEAVDKAAKLFKADIAALDASSAVVALYDGLAKDSGVSMEIGYAFAKCIPIIVLSTDFMHEVADGCSVAICDPTVARMAARVVHRPEARISATDYASAHILDFQVAAVQAATALADVRPAQAVYPAQTMPRPKVYCDFLGGRFQWTRESQETLAAKLKRVGISCVWPKRFAPEFKTGDVAVDIQAVADAECAVFTLDTLEIDAAGGALIGFAYGLGKRIILVSSTTVRAASAQGQVMRVNLMLEQAASHIVASLDEAVTICESVAE